MNKRGKSRTVALRRVLASVLGITLLLSASSLFAAKRYAAVFASNYKGNSGDIPPLDLCEKDGDLFKTTIEKYGSFDDVKVYLGQQVTAANVKNTIAELSRKVGPDDTVVFFFAGHGTFTRDAKAPNGLQNTIVMFDRPHISDDQLNVWLKAIKTKKLLWVFDCCFSGGIVKKGKRGMNDVPIAPGQNGKVIENGQDDFYFDNKALIGSSDADETSIEIGGNINQGIFTYWFAQGMKPDNGDLNKDESVTALEAFEWASRRVTEMAEKFNHKQHPQICGNASGIILAGRITPKPPEPSPKPNPVDPPDPNDKPKPNPIPDKPTPTDPVKPVTPDEPPVVDHVTTSTAHIYTTIFESRGGGVNSVNPGEKMRLIKLAKEKRRVRVLISGKDFESTVTFLDRAGLKSATGEDISLGYYNAYDGGTMYEYKNKVAYIKLEKVPTGVHQIEIQADDYPIIKRRLGVEKDASRNKLFVVASMTGYGTIRGKIFVRNFETPKANQDVWMPVVKYPGQKFKMTTLKDGSFWFLNLPPANDYQIKPSFLEGNPIENKKITVVSGKATKIDVILQN